MFNRGMAKKKSGTQKKKDDKKSKGSALEQLKRVKWYMWVLIALTVYFGGLYTFKYFATQHDIKLLDEAEAKMRQLDFGDATSVEFSRSCSVRSVKYGDPGKPSCRVRVTANYDSTEKVSVLKNEMISKGYNLELFDKNSTSTYYKLPEFDRDLSCTLGEITDSELLDGDRAVLYCQKEFWKQVYPED